MYINVRLVTYFKYIFKLITLINILGAFNVNFFLENTYIWFTVASHTVYMYVCMYTSTSDGLYGL